jgi:nucleoside phosphorylase
MHESTSSFGQALFDVLRDLPGDLDALERDACAHASRPLPVVTILGAYDSGKSSLVKRLLVDDRREVPPWLTVSARRETFEARECEAFGCTLRDTPGISGGNLDHERLAREALALSDAIVVTVTPQLLTSERDAILDILTGRLFTAGGLAFPPYGLHVVVSRMDEAGIDPIDDFDGYAALAKRKLAELRDILERGGVAPNAIHLHALCADPFQRTAPLRQPARSFFDDSRAWDGITEFEEMLRGLQATLPTLRAAATARYFALAATSAASTIEDQLTRQKLALDTCRTEVERLSLFEKQLDVLSSSAQSSLGGLVEQEIQSSARMHALSLAEVTQQAESALDVALGRWRNEHDAAVFKLAREAGEELAARKGSPARRSLEDMLGRAKTRSEDMSKEPIQTGFVEGLRRFGPRLADAMRALHEVKLGVSFEEASRELARVNALGSFEKYIKETGKHRILRDAVQATSIDSAVRLHGAIAAVGPLLVELGALYAEQQWERRAAAEYTRRLAELRARIGDAARAIAADEWRDWEQGVTVFRTSLHERLMPHTRLESLLAATVDQLTRTGSRLARVGAERPGTAPRDVSPVPSYSTSKSVPNVDFLLITALEEEREALLSKLPGVRKLDRDGAGTHTYYEAEVATHRKDGAVYRVIVTSLSGMGPTKAAIKASAVIQRWDPPYVLMIGIAGGIEGEVALGDVMVASQVVDYTLGKVRDDGPREERWTVSPADADLRDAAANFPTSWEDLVVQPRPADGRPQRHIGVIASGGDVIASKKQIAVYREDWPKLIGVEMEGGGMAEALHDDIKRPRFLMLRGVSDLADGEDNAEMKKRWRAYGCDVAAAYAIGLLRDGPVMARTSG